VQVLRFFVELKVTFLPLFLLVLLATINYTATTAAATTTTTTVALVLCGGTLTLLFILS